MAELLTSAQIAALLDEIPGLVAGPLGALSLSLALPTPGAAIATMTQIATAGDAANHHPDVFLSYRRVEVTSTTHDAGGITGLDELVIREAVRIAAANGGAIGPSPARVEIAIDAVSPSVIAPFWAAGLSYRTVPSEKGGELHDPAGRGPVVWFQLMTSPRTDRSRIHLDVYLPLDQVPSRLQACIAAGGRLLTDEFAPSWWVLADPEGNELCLCTHEVPA